MRNGTIAQQLGPTPNGAALAGGEGDLYWDALAPVVSEALAQPLDPALVSQRRGRGGRTFDYIEGHTAIDQANRIFGYGGWGYELLGDVTLHEIKQTDSRSGEIARSAAYAATVRVTVPGAPARTDVGFQPLADDSVEAHETAYKGAVTDALKRALRSFGDRFGNGLYGDSPPHARNSRTPSQPRPEPTPVRRPARLNGTPPRSEESDARNLRAQLIELSTRQGFTEEQVRAAVRRKTGRELDQLSVAELTPLVASAAEKLQQRQEAVKG